jgi:hypothetical protein
MAAIAARFAVQNPKLAFNIAKNSKKYSMGLKIAIIVIVVSLLLVVILVPIFCCHSSGTSGTSGGTAGLHIGGRSLTSGTSGQ